MESSEQQSGSLQGDVGSLAELLRIAVPLMLSSGSLSLMHVVDRMFMTWSSHDALAAALPAGLMHWTCLSLPIGTALYVNTFVAQYEGAGRPERVASALWQGVWWAVLSALVLIAAVPIAPKFFNLIGHRPEVTRLETIYFSTLCWGSLPQLLLAVLSCFYSGRGKTWTVMWVNVSAVLVNVVLDYLLIFGRGGFPEMGIRGAALATVIANVFGTLLYAGLLLGGASGREYRLLSSWHFDRDLFRRLLRFGLPNGMQFFVDVTAFAAFVFLIGQMGTTELAATNLAFNLNTLAFIPLVGLGTAVSTLVGKRIGENRPALAVKTTWSAFRLAGGYMLSFALVYLLLPHVLFIPYQWGSSSEELARTTEVAAVLLRFVAVFGFFDAMVIVFGAAIRGAGDTHFPMIASLVLGWAIMVVPTVAARHWLGGSVWAGWTAATAYIMVLGVVFLWRFLGGAWQSMRVIESTEDEATTFDCPNGVLGLADAE